MYEKTKQIDKVRDKFRKDKVREIKQMWQNVTNGDYR